MPLSPDRSSLAPLPLRAGFGSCLAASVLAVLAANCGVRVAFAGDTPGADGPGADGPQPEVLILGEVLSTPTSAGVLNVGSPQSAVSSQVIQEIASPVGDYGTVANFTPSYVSSAPNGPGFDAAKNQTLRGFVDGQFNVTLDGIPFADPDNFQHHSTSYFPTTQLDRLVIDRSPGGAADLGYASFGGSINLFTAAIPQVARVRAFADYGSFDTSLIGATLNTAAPQSSGETGVVATIERSRTEGAMSLTNGYKDDVLVKSVTWLGEARLTAFYAYDTYHFYNPGSISTTDLALYGSSYGYANDSTSPNDYLYSNTHRAADFGYLRLEIPLGDHSRVQETPYTYSYRNTGLSLKGDQTSSPLGAAFPGTDATDIAGKLADEDYRTVGNDLRLTGEGPLGTFLVGVWAEHDWQTESRDAVDLTTGMVYDANRKADSPVYFDFDAHLDTVQPYAQFAWQVTTDWAMRFGLRYRSVRRDLDAAVIQNFLPGPEGTITRTVSSTLPSVDTTYRIADNTDLYAQVSKGSLVPNQSFFYTANPALGNQANPETALATQLGVVRELPRYGVGLDLYSVNFNNYVSTITENGDTLYVNSGRVLYRGIETEDHVRVAGGLTLVLNASLIRATFQDADITSPIQMAGDTIPYAPSYTGVFGFVYGQGAWGASLLAKFVGTEYQGKNGSADSSTYRVGAYSYTNATLTRNLPERRGTRNVRLTLRVDNLWDTHAITDNAGPSTVGPDLVNVLPRRNYMLSAVVDF